jgi:hypothetical protein
MIRYFLVTLCLLLSFNAFAQKAPYGTLKVGSSFVRETEVTQKEWAMMIYLAKQLNFLKVEGAPNWQSLLPDNNAYNQKTFYSNTFIQSIINADEVAFKAISFSDFYSSDTHFPSDQEYPICGVSYSQVNTFLTLLQNYFNKVYAKNGVEPIFKVHSKYSIRLPNETEFMSWMTALDDQALAAYRKGYNDKCCPLMNTQQPDSCANCPMYSSKDVVKLGPIGKAPYPVVRFNATNNGLYDVYGNLAEMLNVEGQCLGGSFQDEPSAISKMQTMPYTTSQTWLGFRYIIQVQ